MKRQFAITLSIAAALTVLQFVARAGDPKPPATGPSTKPTTKPTTAPVVEIQPDGSLLLKAEGARVHGYKLHLELKPAPALVYWIDATEYPEWPQAVARKGSYAVELTYSCPFKAGGDFTVSAAANKVVGKTGYTADWHTFTTLKLGTLTVLNDNTSIAIRSAGRQKTALMNVRSIKLTPIAEEAPKVKDKKKR